MAQPQSVDDFLGPEPQASQSSSQVMTADDYLGLPASVRADDWGPGHALLQGVSLGTLIHNRALEQARTEMATPPAGMTNPLFMQAFRKYIPYDDPKLQARAQQIEQQTQAARSGFNQAHPFMGTGLEIAGSLVPMAAVDLMAPEIGLPASLGRAGVVGGRVLTGMERGSLVGGLGTELTGGDVGSNTELGAGIGGAFPLVGAGVRALGPHIDENVLHMAQRAEELGVNLRPGQLATGAGSRKLDSVLAGGYNTGQMKDYVRAISHTFGADADALTPAVLSTSKSKIQDTLDSIANRTQLQLDQQFKQDMNRNLNPMNLSGMEMTGKRQIMDVVRTIYDAGENGPIDGATYQRLTQKGGPIDKLLQSKIGGVRAQGIKMREALDDALARHSPADAVEQLQAARGQWKNLMVVEPLVEKSGAAALADPQSLLQAVRRNYSEYGWQAPSDIGTLAEAGQFMPKVVPQGASAPMKGHGLLPWGLAGAAGAGEIYSTFTHNPELGMKVLGALGLAYGGKKATGAALASDWYRSAFLHPDAGLTPVGKATRAVAEPMTIQLTNRAR